MITLEKIEFIAQPFGGESRYLQLREDKGVYSVWGKVKHLDEETMFEKLEEGTALVILPVWKHERNTLLDMAMGPGAKITYVKHGR